MVDPYLFHTFDPAGVVLAPSLAVLLRTEFFSQDELQDRGCQSTMLSTLGCLALTCFDLSPSLAEPNATKHTIKINRRRTVTHRRFFGSQIPFRHQHLQHQWFHHGPFSAPQGLPGAAAQHGREDQRGRGVGPGAKSDNDGPEKWREWLGQSGAWKLVEHALLSEGHHAHFLPLDSLSG